MVSGAHSMPADDDGIGTSDPDALKAEIDATREHLSLTVDELGRRLDPAARAKEGAARAKDTAVETYRENPPIVITAGVVLLAAVVGIVVWRKKHAKRRTVR